MKLAVLRWVSFAPLLGAGFFACSVEDRALTYEYRALATAGLPSSAGHDSGGDASGTNGGDGALPEAGDNGALGGSTNSLGGSSGDAGSPTTDLGGGAGATIAGSGGSAGAGLGGSATGGAPVAAGAAGHAGSESLFPCGDLNQDSVDDCTQTLVQNSRFDAAVSDWTVDPPTSQVWDPRNGSDKAGSGSILVSTSATVDAPGWAAVGSHQCIPVTPATDYDFAARVMLVAGQTDGQAGVNVWLFDDDVCQGNIVAAHTPLAGGVVGAWKVLKARLWITGGVHSMYVRLVAMKPFVQPSLSVLFDDVLVAKR